MTSSLIRDLHARGCSLADIAAELNLEYRADSGELVLGGWWADDGNQAVEYLYETAEEAASEYVAGGNWWGEGVTSVAISVRVWRAGFTLDDDDELAECIVDEDSHIVLLHPDEPACKAADDGEHRWESPHELVGGIEENPGVWGGPGCGITSVEVCVFCGVSRTTATASQGHDTEHDHCSVRYGGNHDVSLDRLVDYHIRGDEIPEGLDSDSDLAVALEDHKVEQVIEWLNYTLTDSSDLDWTIEAGCGADEALEQLRIELPGHTIEVDDEHDDGCTLVIDRRR